MAEGFLATMKKRSTVGMRRKADRMTYAGSGAVADRKIALVGTAPSGEYAPYEDPSWEIWGVSARAEYVTRADRWFELHRLSGEPNEWMARWRDELTGIAKDTPLFMLYPSIEGAVAYPFDHITARFGTYFMTSSFAWMMALALDELCPIDAPPIGGEIAIFGVDMEYDSEYEQQRAGFRHFLDLAKAWGVGVTRLASSGLAYEPIPYPMCQDDPLLNKLDKKQVEARGQLDTIEATLAVAERGIAENVAVIAALREYGPPNLDTGREIKRMEKETAKLRESVGDMQKNFIRWETAEAEQQWLRDYLTP